VTRRRGGDSGERPAGKGATWFPGEMARTRRLIRENLPLTRLVIEVADARAPRASRYPGLHRLVPGRPILTVLAKADLADPAVTRLWLEWLENRVGPAGEGVADPSRGAATAFSAAAPGSVRALGRLVGELGRRSGRPGPVRAVVVGLPNVGKSTLINRLAGRSSARTGDRPGITRGKQWIRTREGFELCDFPGILVPGRLPRAGALILAVLGILPGEAFEMLEVAELVLRVLAGKGALPPEIAGVAPAQERETAVRRPSGTPEPGELLARYALARGHLRAGGLPDLDRAALALVRSFREGRFGRVSLEVPPAGGPQGGGGG